jgi:hypothetical protein
MADSETARRMRAIAAGLQAAGLTAALHETRGVLDITAACHRPGAKDIKIILDEDGYAEIRYWNHDGAPPAQVVAVMLALIRHIP